MPAFALENARGGNEDECGCQIARMQMLVGDVQRRSRYRQRKHGRNHGDSSQLSSALDEDLPGDPVACPKDEEQRDELPAQLRPG